jgi:hypothetical protein
VRILFLVVLSALKVCNPSEDSIFEMDMPGCF